MKALHSVQKPVERCFSGAEAEAAPATKAVLEFCHTFTETLRA
ncbi:hypothetical protein SDC9_152136 [bioreactor metagenome]|uniref:Uncharacterized protein n=1 Tax=bioreactor metagenome TaxID=1076179 RepID=A0A645ES88_9ZZZZ